MWDGFAGPATDLVVAQGATATVTARAAIVMAAGAALFSSVVVGDDPALVDEVRALVRAALAQSLAAAAATRS
jgi:hypothetical protein